MPWIGLDLDSNNNLSWISGDPLSGYFDVLPLPVLCYRNKDD